MHAALKDDLRARNSPTMSLVTTASCWLSRSQFIDRLNWQ